MLYIIDRTSRMYGFELPDAGIEVRIGGETYIVTMENQKLDIFEDAICNGKPIVIIDNKKGNSVYSGRHLIGVQFAKG